MMQLSVPVWVRPSARKSVRPSGMQPVLQSVCHGSRSRYDWDTASAAAVEAAAGTAVGVAMGAAVDAAVDARVGEVVSEAVGDADEEAAGVSSVLFRGA